VILHITRHGQVQAATADSADLFVAPGDPPLSALGRRQARLLGEHLRDLGFAGSVHTSPYRRAAETGQIVADVVDVALFLALGMRESNGDGERMAAFRGATMDELRTDYPRLRVDADSNYPWWTTAAESAEDIEERVGPVVAALEAKEEDVLLVGHGATVGAATRYVLNRRAPELMGAPRFPWNCMLTSLRLAPEFEMIRLASTDHLPADAMTSNAKDRKQVLEILARAR
jgi:broad specificity phosphatase PhoE